MEEEEGRGETSGRREADLRCVCVPAGPVTTLYLILCDPMHCIPPGSSVHGVSQARQQVWVAISCSRGSSQSKDQIEPVSLVSPALAGGFLITEPTVKPQDAYSSVLTGDPSEQITCFFSALGLPSLVKM